MSLKSIVRAWVDTKPSKEEIVRAIVLHTSSLELTREEHVEFAPIKGTCGPFRLRGNGLPVFTYTVFEKSLMEFITIRVEVSRPNNIRYIATIDSTTAPEQHGKIVEVKGKYKAPFEALASHLHSYFPLYRKIDGMRNHKT